MCGGTVVEKPIGGNINWLVYQLLQDMSIYKLSTIPVDPTSA